VLQWLEKRRTDAKQQGGDFSNLKLGCVTGHVAVGMANCRRLAWQAAAA